MRESILNHFYANQARLEALDIRQPFRTEDPFANEGRLMSEKLLWVLETVNPLQLWIIQLGIIICTAALLSFFLREIRQPKVIAEVLSGIVLGPTVCGRILGFTEHVFPPESRPYLNLTADIGLYLFFFLLGLQIEPSIVKKNLRSSAVVALAGMIIPFVTGAGLSVPLYRQFVNDSENIQPTHFMFFAGVAFSVTAFPVMCRILTELKLLDTTVGAAVISAGVGNDIIGWILLALSVTMLKAGSSLEAMYMVLSCAGWILILLFPVKSFLRRLAEVTGSIGDGPSMPFMTIAILVLFGSGLVTDVNGVHGIFGAFLTGLIIPREGNLAIAMSEKLEDIVEIIFLPFYFALLGMSTDLGFLNDGITWIYTISIVLAAFVSKFGSCAIAARYTAGFSWRESGAIGSLMSCKGVVELIVLDVGLSAGIFTPRVFTLFVLEALILTFITTPLVIRFYPPHIRKRTTDGSQTFSIVIADDFGSETTLDVDAASKRRFTVVLDKLEHLPAVMAFTQLLRPPMLPGSSHISTTNSLSKSVQKRGPVSIEALRLVELSDRSSTVIRSTDILLKKDHLLAILKMFARLHALPIISAMDITTCDDFADSVIRHARSHGSDMIMLPWLLHSVHPSHPHTDSKECFLPLAHTESVKPTAANAVPKPSARMHSLFSQGVFEHARSDVAIFLDRNIDNPAQGISSHHLLLPFFGGPNDRLALDFVAQLCGNGAISATVLRFIRKNLNETTSMAATRNDCINLGSGHSCTITESDAADDTAWKHYTAASKGSVNSDTFLSRIAFKECVTTLPLHAVVREVHDIKKLGTRLLIVVGRMKYLPVCMDPKDLSDLIAEYGDLDVEVKNTIGDIAAAFVAANCGDGVLVLQKAGCRLS